MAPPGRKAAYKQLRRTLFTGPIFQARHVDDANEHDIASSPTEADADQYLWTSDNSKIHPLFRKAAFSNVDATDNHMVSFFNRPVTDEFYSRITPALHLASLFLEHSIPFLMLLTFARVIHLKRGGDLYFKPDYTPEDTQRAVFNTELEDLGNHLQICWHDPGPVTCNYASLGMTGPLRLKNVRHNTDDLVICLSLHHEIWKSFSFGSFEDKSYRQKSNMWLMLAITLMHEVCHAVYKWRRRDRVRAYFTGQAESERAGEPRLKPFAYAELGYTWEMLYFRGVMEFGCLTKECPRCKTARSTAAHDGSRGVYICRTKYDSSSFKYSTTPNNTVLQLFRKDCWQVSTEERRPKVKLTHSKDNDYLRRKHRPGPATLPALRRLSSPISSTVFENAYTAAELRSKPCPWLESSTTILNKAIYDDNQVRKISMFGRTNLLSTDSENHLYRCLLQHWETNANDWNAIDLDKQVYITQCKASPTSTVASPSPNRSEPFSANWSLPSDDEVEQNGQINIPTPESLRDDNSNGGKRKAPADLGSNEGEEHATDDQPPRKKLKIILIVGAASIAERTRSKDVAGANANQHVPVGADVNSDEIQNDLARAAEAAQSVSPEQATPANSTARTDSDYSPTAKRRKRSTRKRTRGGRK